MSRARRIYCICYALMLLGLAALYFLPSPLPKPTPWEKWSSFQAWLGPPPQELIEEEWATGTDDYRGVTFVFHATEDWHAEITERFGLAESRHANIRLQPHWQEAIAPEASLLTAQRKRLAEISTGEPVYDVKDMTLTRLQDGRTLLAFRYRWDNSFGNHSYVFSAYEPGEGRDFPTWYVVLYGGAVVAFILLVPLGFLLLFPRFDLRKKGHTVLWFATALLFPIGVCMLSIPFMYSGSEALVAFIALLIILVPLQLIGALVLYLIVRNLLLIRA